MRNMSSAPKDLPDTLSGLIRGALGAVAEIDVDAYAPTASYRHQTHPTPVSYTHLTLPTNREV